MAGKLKVLKNNEGFLITCACGSIYNVELDEETGEVTMTETFKKPKEEIKENAKETEKPKPATGIFGNFRKS